MRARIRQNRASAYTPRYAEIATPYTAYEHLRWLLTIPAVIGLLEHLGQVSANPRRRVGLAWREYGFLETRGDAAAIKRWQGEQRALAYLLPPKLRKLVPLLARDRDAPIEIRGGRALDAARARRLQAICLRRLMPGSRPLLGSERAQLFRGLQALDPSREPLVILSVGDLPVGATAAASATAMAAGTWELADPQPGYPNIGTVATALPSALGVLPFDLAAAPISDEEGFTVILSPKATT